MRVYKNSLGVLTAPNAVHHTDDKYIITFKRADLDVAFIQIEELQVTYIVYENDMVIDLTDYAKSLSPGYMSLAINILDASNGLISQVVIDTTLYEGFASNAEFWPLKRVLVCGYADTHQTQIRIPHSGVLSQLISGDWIQINAISAGQLLDVPLEVGTYKISYSDGEDEVEYMFSIEQPDDECHFANQFPVKWISENGYQKQWLFIISDEIRRTLSSVELNRPNNGYTILKNKGVNIKVIERNADIQTRQYLADLVCSSKVETFYIDESDELIIQPISVSDTSVITNFDTKYDDFSLTFNVAKYDIY